MYLDEDFFLFFFPILWCSHIGDDPQEYLAKIGCITDMKVKQIKNHATIWVPAGTYCRNLMILESFLFKIWCICAIL